MILTACSNGFCFWPKRLLFSPVAFLFVGSVIVICICCHYGRLHTMYSFCCAHNVLMSVGAVVDAYAG